MPEIEFPVDAKSLTPSGDKRLDDMNSKYCVINEEGKAFVFAFKWDRDRGRHIPVFHRFSDFQNLHMNHSVKVNGKNVPKGKWWLQNPKRRQYEGLIFQPGNNAQVIDGKLNLWRGWPYEPKQGDWSKLREHIWIVVTSKNKELFDYVMNWLAWCCQHPDRPAEVVLVMRGKKGTGKGTLCNCMCKLFGQHANHISSSHHLVGHFNYHLRDCVLLFADEAYFPGDKAAEGALKRLVTDPTLSIEGKGRNVVEVPNLLHIMMASNDDWVVPAGESERRWVILDVNELHLQKASWFGPLYDQLNNGGYGAMLYDLLHRDLGDWHPRRLPKTNNLSSQQALSLSSFDSWWVTVRYLSEHPA